MRAFLSGAPREGVVPGTGELVNACLPKPEPLHVEPLPPPAEGTGIQLRAPHQVLAKKTERETCFVSYYDYTGKVPDEFLSPDGQFIRVKNIEARQDPLSHHADHRPLREHDADREHDLGCVRLPRRRARRR